MENLQFLFIYSIEWSKSELFPDDFQIERYIIYYRGIFMLNRDCNLTFGRLYFPFMKLGIITLFIVSFFACARIYQYMDIISYMFMVTVLGASLMLLVPISIIMSSLYDISKDFSRNLSPCIYTVAEIRSQKVLTNMLQSCGVIRSQVGNLYHMEAKAKLTMLGNVVDGVVFLLVNVKT